MIHQHATIEDTVYFWFAANDTSGSGGDGAAPLFDVREAGAAAGAIPLLSGTPTLLTHANFPAGCHEIAIAATVANGFAANDTFAVFCTLAIDSQNPSGFVGSCTLTPLAEASNLTTAQDDLDILTGADGVILDTSQPNYAPNIVVPDAAGVSPTAIAIRQEMDSNSVDLNSILTNIAALNNLSAAQVNAEADTALTDFFTSAAQLVIDIWSDTLTTYTNGMAGKRLKGLSAATVVEGEVNDVSATTTIFITTLIGYGTDFFEDTEIAVEISPDKWQPRIVIAYNTTTGEITVDEPFISAPPDTAKIALTMRHVHSISTINAEMDTAIADAALATEAKQDVIDTVVDSILTDTNELQTDWANGGRLDLILDSILADTTSGGIPKNAIFNDFQFPMVLTSDHYTAATGKTVTGQRSIDGGAWTNVTGSIAEVGSGLYTIDLTAADTNGDTVSYKFSATDCDDTIIPTVITRS